MNDLIWFGIAGVALVFAVLFQIVRYRGLKGAMVGAQLRGTVGEVRIAENHWERRIVKVHRLVVRNARTEPCVGLEIDSSLGDHPPLLLTRAQAQALARFLTDAAQ